MKKRYNFLISLIVACIILVPVHLSQTIETHSFRSLQTIRVDNEGDGDYKSIQNAIDNAQSGDIIEVYSGTYQETLLITQSQLSIKGIPYELGSGTDTDNPIIQGSKSGDVITIQKTEITLSGFIIQHSGSNYFDAGIGIYADNNIIKENGITGNFYGIVLNNCSQNTVANNYILANVMDGIYLCSTHQNTISNNIIKENGYQGLFLYETDHNMISDNSIFLNDKDGIQLRDECNKNTIQNNEIHSNNIDGIKCMLTEITDNTIQKNTIYSNGWNGIHLMNGNNNHILENDLTLNLFNGIHIGESHDNLIARNTISENKEEGIMILFDTAKNNRIYHNNIINDNAYDNANNQWDNGDAGGNYWSYYTGIDENNDGFGDIPYVIPGINNKDNYPFMHPLAPPTTPHRPTGPTLGTVGQSYQYTTMASANNKVQFGWDWNGDDLVDEWTQFYDSNEECQTTHTWEQNGTIEIKVKAMDNHGFQSEWSEPLTVTMPKNMLRPNFLNLPLIIEELIERIIEWIDVIVFIQKI